MSTTEVPPHLIGLSHGQREGISLLIGDLAQRKDLSETTKADLIADRLAYYHERNEKRSVLRFGPEQPETTGHRYSLLCIDCTRDICPPSAKPRVPLCSRCRNRRELAARPKPAKDSDAPPRRRWMG